MNEGMGGWVRFSLTMAGYTHLQVELIASVTSIEF